MESDYLGQIRDLVFVFLGRKRQSIQDGYRNICVKRKIKIENRQDRLYNGEQREFIQKPKNLCEKHNYQNIQIITCKIGSWNP